MGLGRSEAQQWSRPAMVSAYGYFLGWVVTRSWIHIGPSQQFVKSNIMATWEKLLTPPLHGYIPGPPSYWAMMTIEIPIDGLLIACGFSGLNLVPVQRWLHRETLAGVFQP